MQTVQQGDRIRVHYVKRFQDGSTVSSPSDTPVEVTVGVENPRLPGLGLSLVGLAPGATMTVSVPPEQAYGPSDPNRIRRWARSRFPKDRPLPIGNWVRIIDRQGRRRAVRILEIRGGSVMVDTNRRGAGQALQFDVKLIAICPTDTVRDGAPS